MIHLTNARTVSLNEKVPFRCQLCGDCCRHVADSIMLEPMDAYYLARYLRKQGKPVAGTDDILAQYAHAAWLEDSFPIFLLNTAGTQDACVFLNAGRCSVHEARPWVCRIYPFSVAPGSKSRDFRYFLCTEKPHHFANGFVTTKDWLSQNFSKDARTVLKAGYDTLPILGQNIRSMGKEQFKQLVFQFIYYLYYNYELDKPFLPQFLSNLEKLKKLTSGGTPL